MKSAILAMMTIGLAFAQPKTDLPEYTVMTYTSVKPEATDEWFRSQGVLSEALRKSGMAYRGVYTPVFGATEHLAFTPVSSPAEYDQSHPGEKAMGKAAYDKWVASVRKISNTGVGRVMLRPLPQLAILDAPRGASPLLVVTRTRVAPDRTAEWESRVRDTLIPIHRKVGTKRFVVSRVVFGGPSNEFVTTHSIASLADAEKVVRMVAQSPPKSGLVLSTERLVYRRHRESSFVK